MSGAAESKLNFRLTNATRLILSKGDLTLFEGDAIVNAAAPPLLGGGGVDGAIHRAAGPELVEACRRLPIVQPPGSRCPTGHAKLTPGFKLPARYVIHTVGPIYSHHSPSEAAELLANAHRNSLTVAKEHDIKTIAFPAISCGVYGYPIPDAAKVAIAACREAAGGLEEVHFVMFSDSTLNAWKEEAIQTLEGF